MSFKKTCCGALTPSLRPVCFIRGYSSQVADHQEMQQGFAAEVVHEQERGTVAQPPGER